jgi:O-acetylserine/cysteine efflux transporter
MITKHILGALVVAFVWGLNFVAMKTAFVEIPPFLFLVLRLVVTVFPLILFVPRPKVAFSLLFWISVCQWILHFSFLFSGMYTGLSAGITALLLQSQVIFTILLTCYFYKSRPSAWQIIGLTVSFSGLILLTTHGNCSANWIGVLLICGAAITVSVTNLLFKAVPKDVSMAPIIIWSSALAIPQAIIMAFFFEGWDLMQASLMGITWNSIFALAYTVYISTMVGVVTWARLMQQADPLKVVPFTLLAPVIAMSSGYLLLSENLTWIDVIASIVIISGLLVNQLSALKRAKIVKLKTEVNTPLKKAA